MADKQTYAFGNGVSEGDISMINILGGKGAHLCEMSRLGLPVPIGFVIPTYRCMEYFQTHALTKALKEEIRLRIEDMAAKLNKFFGSPAKNKPLLLLSVRSGSVISMPGMMDTILNVGISEATVPLLAAVSSGIFAKDCFRRFIQMFGSIAYKIDHNKFQKIYNKLKLKHNFKSSTIVNEDFYDDLIAFYKVLFEKELKISVNIDPYEQVYKAIESVFDSWNNKRAIEYRKANGISGDIGTAVTIQAMVFGNLNPNSCTGVVFTRNPSSGERKIFGEYLIGAQGEDIVSGAYNPRDIYGNGSNNSSMEQTFPTAFAELQKIAALLEGHYCDMQDIEFTVEDGRLWILQTRSGNRSAIASLNILTDLVEEEKLTIQQAIMKINPLLISHMLHPYLDIESLDNTSFLGEGLPASPGAVTGKILFDTDEIINYKTINEKENIILIRNETNADDIEAIRLSAGLVTAHGGLTSHAAVVTRGMGKPSIVGCNELSIINHKTCSFNGIILKKNDIITIDGNSGRIYRGKAPIIKTINHAALDKIIGWCEDYSTMKVYANADTPEDCKVANLFKAAGIGLSRTEHMFFNKDKLTLIRAIILYSSLLEGKEYVSHKQKLLDKLEKLQAKDFYDLFLTMPSKPFSLRLLDPPLHEFLPRQKEDIQELAMSLAISIGELERIINSYMESNPMLGFRGVRLGIIEQDIYYSQIRAMFQALRKIDVKLRPKMQIMVPFVSTEQEVVIIKKKIKEIALGYQQQYKEAIQYGFGTMIEIPRACLIADKIAPHVDFFCFGTNDLSQMTFGVSRDDGSRFIPGYIERSIIDNDPFTVIDAAGVGEMIKIAIEKGRLAKPGLEIGICGEHGGDPESIKFFHTIGVNYVSCSPFRIPVAKLSVAQYKISEKL